MREAVHARVQEQLPDIVRTVTGEIGAHIDQLLDIKLMVISRIEERPELANRIFLEVGRRELRFMINFGFFFGLVLGIPLVFLTEAVPHWWVLPIGGVVIGYVTNWVGLWMIFEPLEPRKLGPLTLHGLFMRRQPEVSRVYSGIIAEDIVTLRNIGQELLHGPSSDRTRQMIETALEPAVDRAAGPAIGPDGRPGGGGAAREYDAIRESIAVEAVDYTMTPLADPQFNRRQSEAVARAGASGGCARCRPRTSRSSCGRRCARTSGCCCSTGPCSGSGQACYIC